MTARLAAVDAAPLPHSIPVEQALLGAILANNDVLHEVQYLEPEHFSEPAHGRIFAACRVLSNAGRTATPVTLNQYFTNDQDLEPVGGAAYLARLLASVVLVRGAWEYGEKILDLWQRRAGIQAARDAIERLSEPAVDNGAAAALCGIAAALDGIAAARSASQTARLDVIAAAAAQASVDRGNGVGEPPLSSGLDDLDRLLGGGFTAGQLIVYGGRPGMGKTSSAVAIAMAVARAGKRVGFFSLEMPAEELAQRALAMVSGQPYKAIRAGDRTAVDTLGEALRPILGLRFDIDDTPALTLPELAGRAAALDRRQKLDLLVVDHIGLMRPTADMRRANKVHQVEEITNGLKALAKRLGCPVLALCQLNRSVEGRDDKRPTLADLRDSGAIEQDADVVMFVHRTEYYLNRSRPRDPTLREQWTAQMADVRNRADIIVAKHRQGEIGAVEVFADVATNRWGNLERGGYDV